MRRSSRLSPGILSVPLVIALLGLGVSFWAHLEAIAGIDPGRHFSYLWTSQLILFALLIPLVVELFRRNAGLEVLRSPQWMRRTLYALLCYYGLNFYLFLYWSADHLDSCATWRMFSSGWLLLFGIAAVFYQVRLLESKNQKS